uniref:Uncharacterized protein n=1 Tax=Sphaerodactylus townsendi TaxID=933632 RepID=A0ACB8EKL1_9SAUR
MFSLSLPYLPHPSYLPAFVVMIILALIRIAKGQGEGHPPLAQLSGIRNLFGVCVYSFMCQHSLPSLITPISKKKHVNKLVLLDYILILGFYSLLSFTAIYCFRNDTIMDMYTLTFTGSQIVPYAFLRYFLGLFPVFTISTNFPIIAVTLKNNWKTLFHREGGTYPWRFPCGMSSSLCLIHQGAVGYTSPWIMQKTIIAASESSKQPVNRASSDSFFCLYFQ